MSPRAAQLMQESEPVSFADLSDMVVAVVTAAGMLFLAGYSLAAYQYETRRTECAATLPDGRGLIARHLGERGDERCVYTAPRPMKRM